MAGRTRPAQAPSRGANATPLRQPLSRPAVRGLVTLLLAFGLVCPGGCTRHFFRTRADREAAEVLAEKDRCAAWKIEDFHVYPDARARFADPTNPDRPPMPPDDPAAHDLSPTPQKPGKAGVALVEGQGYLHLLAAWDEENRAARAGKDKDAPPNHAPDGQPGPPSAETTPPAAD